MESSAIPYVPPLVSYTLFLTWQLRWPLACPFDHSYGSQLRINTKFIQWPSILHMMDHFLPPSLPSLISSLHFLPWSAHSKPHWPLHARNTLWSFPLLFFLPAMFFPQWLAPLLRSNAIFLVKSSLPATLPSLSPLPALFVFIILYLPSSYA